MPDQGSFIPTNPAVVIGLSVHGLAVCRALAKRDVTVHCLAEDTPEPSPTATTRYARIHLRDGLNTELLVTHLLDLARSLRSPVKPVLFPTSDRMVRSIADAWETLEPHYVVSWAHCRELIKTLQRKDGLAHFCEVAGVRYPRSRALHRPEDIAAISRELAWPLVIKPARPLSSFKAIKAQQLGDVERTVREHAQDLPFVVQEWIEGDQASLFACTTYLDHGKPLFTFPSRKLAASPPGLGQGTVFETCPDDGFCEIARRFLAALDLSGPVAVEFKRDSNGNYWLIEPNVGRTEYCVDLLVQSGINLPYVEYLCATGHSQHVQIPPSRRERVWFDTDKDPTCFIRNAGAIAGGPRGIRAPIFPYLGHSDWRPVVAAAVGIMRRGRNALVRRARRLATGVRPANAPLP